VIFSDLQPRAPSYHPAFCPVAPSPGGTQIRAIDIHHHYIPLELIDS
jgi:hypothetical protein